MLLLLLPAASTCCVNRDACRRTDNAVKNHWNSTLKRRRNEYAPGGPLDVSAITAALQRRLACAGTGFLLAGVVRDGVLLPRSKGKSDGKLGCWRGFLLAGAVRGGVLWSRSKSAGLLMSTGGRERQRSCQEDRRRW